MKPTSEPRSGFYSERFAIYIDYFQKLAPTNAEKREELESAKWHANRCRILAFQSSKQSSNLWPSFLLQIAKGGHFRSREARLYVWDFEISGLGGLLSLLNFVVTWMLGKLGRIDGDPVLRETRIWATWEYVSSVGEWYLEICREGQETLGTSGGVLLPKTKLDQSRSNPGIVGLELKAASCRGLCCVIRVLPLIVMAAQLIHDRVEMECLEGAWEILEGNTRCRFRGTIRFTATSLVHPDEPARTLQRTVEWILPTPTPYCLVEPVQLIEGDEDPLPEVDPPEEVMSASEADSTEDSGPREMATSGGSSS
ncbi:hypothetical protein HKD37_17G048273 [Glycine soja]